MSARLALLALVLAAAMPAWGGSLYRWMDAEGRVHYTDSPPPPGAKNVSEKKLSAGAAESSSAALATQQAAKKNPVVLYTSPDCGPPCDSAREYLARRGIPHATRDPRTPEGAEALRKLIGGLEVPVLVVGNATPLKGYEPGAWDVVLDLAGYPKAVSGTKKPTKPVPAKTENPETAPEAKPALN